jgi:thiamine biosynthesis protein ThiS
MGSVTANGESVQLAEPCSLEKLLRQWGFLPRSVVVEHNGEPVAPSEFALRTVQFGDRLEIVRIVAGG